MIFYSLIAVVLLAPLPLGSNRPWAWTFWALLIACIGLAAALNLLLNRNSPYSWRRLVALSDVGVVFAVLLAWIAMQALWHPPAEHLHPLWGMAEQALGRPAIATLSLTPDATLMSLLRLLSYGLTFWLSYLYCQQVENAYKVFKALMLASMLYSLYGLIIQLGGYKTILWVSKEAYFNDLTSTFINRNHFATYAGITLLCAFAMLSDSVLQSSKYHIGGNLGLQRFFEQLVARSWMPLLAFCIIGMALLLTHSRGGFFSSVLGLAVLLFVTFIYQRSRKSVQSSFATNFLMILVLGVAVIACLIFWVSSEGLTHRLETMGLDDGGRLVLFQLTWEAAQTNPWLGFGLGSFEQVFLLYKEIKMAGNDTHPLLWDYAHNTYVESVFELGLPAALALFYCFFRLGVMCLIGAFKRKRHMIYPATGLAVTVLIAAHATTDFSMQIPAIALTYTLLMGAACAQAFTSKKEVN